MVAGLPSKEESNVKRGAVQIYKLEQKHLQSETVLPLRLCSWVLYSGEKQRLWGGQGGEKNQCLPTFWGVRDNEGINACSMWTTLT